MKDLHDILGPVRPEIKKMVEANEANMESSALVLSIYSENYKKDLNGIVQIGLALVHDKPLFLLVPEGTVLGERLKRVADGVEFYREGNDESMQTAVRRLFQLASEKRLCA